MAATPTQLDDGTSTANPASTASIDPATNSLILVTVVATKTGGPPPTETDVALSGLGLTWELVSGATTDYRVRRRLYTFRAQGTPSGPGALTLTYSGASTFQEWQWSISEWSGVAVGNNGADAIGAPGTNSVGTGSTQLTCTTTYGPNPGDATYSAHGVEQSGGTPTLEAGWTELSRRESGNVRHLIVGWDVDQDVSATISWTDSNTGAGNLILAVVADGSGGISGSGAATAPAGAASGAGAVTVGGSAAAVAPGGQAAGSGSVTVAGSAAVLAPAATAAGAGTVGDGTAAAIRTGTITGPAAAQSEVAGSAATRPAAAGPQTRRAVDGTATSRTITGPEV